MNREDPRALELSIGKHPGLIRFPARDLSMRGPVRVTIYSQPLGISYDPVTDQVVIADYYQPQVRLGKVRQDGDDIVIDMTFVRGAEGTIRLFPDFFKGDFNRAQTAFLDLDGNLCVTRNGDRKIFVITPQTEIGKKPWKLLGEITFPDDAENDTMVHSLLFSEERKLVTTIESDVRCEYWNINFYNKPKNSDMLVRRVNKKSIGGFRCGIGHWDDRVWTITDFRTSERPGVYADDRCVIPGLCGNGIAFLPGGDAIVTQYGSSIEQPGALVFVPAHMFK